MRGKNHDGGDGGVGGAGAAGAAAVGAVQAPILGLDVILKTIYFYLYFSL